MARKSGSTILQEELYPASAGAAREEIRDSGIDDARLVDLDGDEESPFLRGPKASLRPPKFFSEKNCKSLAVGRSGCGSCVCCRWALPPLYHYGEHSWRFRVESSDNIEVTGMQNVTKAQIMEVMAPTSGETSFSFRWGSRRRNWSKFPGWNRPA